VGIARAEKKLRALLRRFRFTSIATAFEPVRPRRFVPDAHRAAS
jgi:hypothetical protein